MMMMMMTPVDTTAQWRDGKQLLWSATPLYLTLLSGSLVLISLVSHGLC